MDYTWFTHGTTQKGSQTKTFGLSPETSESYICAMEILDGKKAAQAIREELRISVASLAAEGKKVPHLAAILVGNNGPSETYVAAKVKACKEVGFKSTLIRFQLLHQRFRNT